VATTNLAVEAAPALAEARGVCHDFHLASGHEQRVLEDIDLAIHREEVVALLGPSGCGKSTLLRILAGLIKPTAGRVLAHGKSLVGLNPGVAIVFQSFALYPWMTVEENVQVVLKAAGFPRGDVHERAARAVRHVGLAGSETSYPRQLSGGMKQRVGMARALSVDPEILFMDEPFSQVDALTAESLRAEVIDIWAAKDRNPSAILMVSHDIKEVVYMADRIVVLAANPGRVLRVVDNKLPRPRDYRSPEVLRLVDQLHEIITGHEMPDAPPPPPTAGPEAPEPLPEAIVSEVTGLLEYLDARGGSEDVVRIAADAQREFGQVITVVKAAEILDLVDTPKRTVVLAAAGKRFVKATPEARKDVWREQLLQLGLFRAVRDRLAASESEELEAEAVTEMILELLPHENPHKIFETLVRWARFGNLFVYDEDTSRLRLPP